MALNEDNDKKKMYKIYRCVLLSITLLLCSESSSPAQQVSKKALEKANWYSAPREFQIIDDRPVVKDFREAPQQAGTVDFGGATGGGVANTVPAGGLHLGQPSVRTTSDNLPKAGFGSNVPARGLVPATALPSGGLRGYAPSAPAVAGHLPSATNRSYVTRRVPTPTSTAAARPVAPAVVRSYSGGYGTAPAAKSYTTSEHVRGKLLKSK